MNILDLLPLIAIPVIYFAVAFIKPSLQSKLPFNICAVCVAVSLTWLTLLVLWLSGMAISTLSIGILMGTSVAGIMYKADEFYKKNRIRNFWFVRLVLILGGFYGISFVLEQMWNELTLLIVGVFFAIIIPSFFLQGLTHTDVLNEQKNGNGKGVKSALLKKLENCC